MDTELAGLLIMLSLVGSLGAWFWTLLEDCLPPCRGPLGWLAAGLRWYGVVALVGLLVAAWAHLILG